MSALSVKGDTFFRTKEIAAGRLLQVPFWWAMVFAGCWMAFGGGGYVWIFRRSRIHGGAAHKSEAGHALPIALPLAGMRDPLHAAEALAEVWGEKPQGLASGAPEALRYS